MFHKIQVKIIDAPIGGLKSGRNSGSVVASVQQGIPIPRGDVGAFLVGVFACQPLANDGTNYDLVQKGQWRHCLYKQQWRAALEGRDEFTDEQKALILAGAVLLRNHSHGWGNQAIMQPHVRKLIEQWSEQDQKPEAEKSNGLINTHVKLENDASLSRPLAGEKPRSSVIMKKHTTSDSSVAEFDQIIQAIENKSAASWYEVGRAWLVEWTASKLGGYNREQVEVIVDLHLDPKNYPLNCITNYHQIHKAIAEGKNSSQVSKLLDFENVRTLLGVYRVHCRNLVNRQGVSDINQSLPDPTKAPKIMTFLDSLDDANWHNFDRCELLCNHYLQVATNNRSQVFSELDIKSFYKAKELGNRLFTTKTTEADRLEIMQGWIKVLKGMSYGVKYLRQFNMDVNKFLDHVSSMCATYRGIDLLLKEYKKIPEVGEALAPNFFGDLGFMEFCKPDTHICEIINSIDDARYNEQQVFERMCALAKDSMVAPRQLDKVFYLAGSGNFYLVNLRLSSDRDSIRLRRNSLIHHLRKYQITRKFVES